MKVIINRVVQYKCDDGKLKFIIKSKDNGTLIAKGSLKHQKDLRLIPKDTFIFANDEILTIRFSLDKTQLQDTFAKFD